MIYLISIIVLVFFILFLMFRIQQSKSAFKLELQNAQFENVTQIKLLESQNEELIIRKKKMESNFKNIIEENKIEHNDEVEKIKKEYESRIEILKAEFKDNFLNQKNEYEKMQNNLKNGFKESLDDLNNFYEKEAEKLKVELKKERELQIEIQSKKIKEEMIKNFEDISNKALQQNSENMIMNSKNILLPLKEQITLFKNELDKNKEDSKINTEILKKEIQDLSLSSGAVKEQTERLANALKQNSKQRGLLGEMLLENILNISGLRKGFEYETQEHLKNMDNQKIIPDVVLYLPNNRSIAVDSKVSMVGYEKYINEKDANGLKEHINSVKNHIEDLSSKSYHEFTRGNKLDFTIMFMPFEDAFQVVMNNENILSKAYEKNIIFSSPSTIIGLIKIIDLLWKIEARDKNFNLILDSCKSLIFKFDIFLRKFENIGKTIEKTLQIYEESYGNLKTGKGSVNNILNKLKNNMSKVDPDLLTELKQKEEENKINIMHEEKVN